MLGKNSIGMIILPIFLGWQLFFLWRTRYYSLFNASYILWRAIIYILDWLNDFFKHLIIWYVNNILLQVITIWILALKWFLMMVTLANCTRGVGTHGNLGGYWVAPNSSTKVLIQLVKVEELRLGLHHVM